MVTLDVSNDWTIFDWTQGITYYSCVSDGVFSSPISVQALKREDKKGYEIFSNVEVSSLQCIWEIFETTFQTPTICKRADKFLASVISGVQTWVVESVDYSDNTSRFRVLASQVGQNS